LAAPRQVKSGRGVLTTSLEPRIPCSQRSRDLSLQIRHGAPGETGMGQDLGRLAASHGREGRGEPATATWCRTGAERGAAGSNRP